MSSDEGEAASPYRGTEVPIVLQLAYMKFGGKAPSLDVLQPIAIRQHSERIHRTKKNILRTSP